ncbi:MAG: hypothetical protein IJF83_10860 [Methanobrevibacter sp.]|nr:hypothetical protein [Methanobrevibacter sp.]
MEYKLGNRITVDFDSESYYYGDQYFESWDNFGEEMADAINNLLDQIENKDPETIEDYFNKWDNLITWIDKSSRRITEIDEQYKELSKTVLQEAIEKDVDFKAIYGGNTEKTRKQYVDEQLAPLLDEKKELEFLKANDLKRIEFIKKFMDMQRAFIDGGLMK